MATLRRDGVGICATIFALFAVVDVSSLLVRVDFDASRLVRAGPPLTDPAATLPSLTVVPSAWTFDGQFFYRLAVSPFSTASQVAGVSFDVPALRGTRLGMGVLGYVLSLGQSALVPISLVVVNVLGMTVLGALAGYLAQALGRHPSWGLTMLIWPGFAYTLAVDTAEIVAAVALVGALLALRSGHMFWAVAGLTLAVLTRESTIAVAAGIGIGALTFLILHRVRPQTRETTHSAAISGIVASGSAGIAFLAVQLYGVAQFGVVPLLASGESNLGVPFTGIVGGVARAFPPTSPGQILDISSLALILLLVVGGAVALHRSRATIMEKGAWIVSAVLMLSITGPWISAPSSMRAGTELYILTVVVVLAVPRSRMPRVLLTTAIGFVVLVWILTVGTMLARVPQAL